MPKHAPPYRDPGPMVVRFAEPRDVPRTTVVASTQWSGVGVHGGRPARVTVSPGPFGHGIVFVTSEGTVRADPRRARAGEGRLVLERGDVRVETPEHLLAACAGLGLTDLRVEIEGPEVPILDGSAQRWVDGLREAGRLEGPPWRRRTLPALEVRAAGGRAWCAPGPDRLLVAIDFGPRGPCGRLETSRDVAGFLSVADAKTFVLADQVEALRRAGRGRGATTANTLVWSVGDSSDGPLRHKALDAWGDLAVLGPVAGTIGIERGSHALHQALINEIVAHWRLPPTGYGAA